MNPLSSAVNTNLVFPINKGTIFLHLKGAPQSLWPIAAATARVTPTSLTQGRGKAPTLCWDQLPSYAARTRRVGLKLKDVSGYELKNILVLVSAIPFHFIHNKI